MCPQLDVLCSCSIFLWVSIDSWKYGFDWMDFLEVHNSWFVLYSYYTTHVPNCIQQLNSRCDVKFFVYISRYIYVCIIYLFFKIQWQHIELGKFLGYKYVYSLLFFKRVDFIRICVVVMWRFLILVTVSSLQPWSSATVKSDQILFLSYQV